MYDNPERFHDAEPSDAIVDEQSYIPIADHFKYFSRFISRVVTDDRDIDVRILKAINAFGSIRKSLFGSQYVHDSVQGSTFESLILPVLLEDTKYRCLTDWFLQKLRSFHNRCVRAMCRANANSFISNNCLRTSSETLCVPD